jgi:hypothetical protein
MKEQASKLDLLFLSKKKNKKLGGPVAKVTK